MTLGSQLETADKLPWLDFRGLPQTKKAWSVCLGHRFRSTELLPQNSWPHCFQGEGAIREEEALNHRIRMPSVRPRTESSREHERETNMNENLLWSSGPSQQLAYMTAQCQATVWFANTSFPLALDTPCVLNPNQTAEYNFFKTCFVFLRWRELLNASEIIIKLGGNTTIHRDD